MHATNQRSESLMIMLMLYMKTFRINFFTIIIVSFVSILSGCAGTSTLSPKYEPQAGSESMLDDVSGLKVKVINFSDKREGSLESTMIGRRTAAFDTPMGDVQSDRPVFEIITDAIKKELIRNGHTLVTTSEDLIVKGEILDFWVGTDTTTTYWDVYGQVSLAVEISKVSTGQTAKFGPFKDKNVERTYLNPSVEIMNRVLAASLDNVILQISNDESIAKTFK